MKNYEIIEKEYKYGFKYNIFKDLKTNSTYKLTGESIENVECINNSEYIVTVKHYNDFILYHLNFNLKDPLIFSVRTKNKIEKKENTFIIKKVNEINGKENFQRYVLYNPKNKLPLKCDFIRKLDDNNILCAKCLNANYDYEISKYQVDDILFYKVDVNNLKTDRLYSTRKESFIKVPMSRSDDYDKYLKSLERTITRFNNENYKPYKIKNEDDIIKIYSKKN